MTTEKLKFRMPKINQTCVLKYMSGFIENIVVKVRVHIILDIDLCWTYCTILKIFHSKFCLYDLLTTEILYL